MALGYLRFCLVLIYLFDGARESLQKNRLRHGYVVRGQEQLDLGFECRQSCYRTRVGAKVGLGDEEINRAGIETVASKEQSVPAIEQGDRVRGMSGSEYDFHDAAAEIDPLAIPQ